MTRDAGEKCKKYGDAGSSWENLKEEMTKGYAKMLAGKKSISFSVSKQMLNCLLCVMKLGLEEKHKN